MVPRIFQFWEVIHSMWPQVDLQVGNRATRCFLTLIPNLGMCLEPTVLIVGIIYLKDSAFWKSPLLLRHLHSVCDWTLLKATPHELLRIWWVGEEICSSCGHPVWASFLIKPVSLEWYFFLWSLPCPLCTRPIYEPTVEWSSCFPSW